MDRMLRYTVTEEDLRHTAGGILGKLLKSRMGLSAHEISRAKFTPGGISLLRNDCGSDGFVPATVKDRAGAGDMLQVVFSEKISSLERVLSSDGEISILYEDSDVLVLDKPAGVASHPSHGHYRDTLANYVMGYFKKQGIRSGCRIAGRLDKDTSGVIVFAKNAPAASRLFRQKKEGLFHKTYLAVVACQGGITDRREWQTVNLPIEPVPGELMKQRIAVTSLGREAVTRYRFLSAAAGMAVIEAEILTGRTHQIRVHMSSVGHPLIGDRLYGDGSAQPQGAGRALLHSWRAVFRQPFDGRKIAIEAPVPGDMAGSM